MLDSIILDLNKFDYILMAVCFVLVIQLCMQIKMRFVNKRNKELTIGIKKIRNEISFLYKGAVGVGDRINKMEEQINQLVERQGQLELRETDVRSFNQARSLVETGADIDEIMKNCGVTRGEAELISELHRLSL